jgi:hypothetical protein
VHESSTSFRPPARSPPLRRNAPVDPPRARAPCPGATPVVHATPIKGASFSALQQRSPIVNAFESPSCPEVHPLWCPPSVLHTAICRAGFARDTTCTCGVWPLAEPGGRENSPQGPGTATERPGGRRKPPSSAFLKRVRFSAPSCESQGNGGWRGFSESHTACVGMSFATLVQDEAH